MKRFLALALSAVMLVSLFTGCAQSEIIVTESASSANPENELDKTTVATSYR